MRVSDSWITAQGRSTFRLLFSGRSPPHRCDRERFRSTSLTIILAGGSLASLGMRVGWAGRAEVIRWQVAR
jgi:hypothetical protein